MRKLRIGLVIIALVVLVGGGTWALHDHLGPVATRQQAQQLKSRVRLVAVGDSLTAGQGDEKAAGGYVSQIQTRLESKYHNQVTTTNLGESGDRSDQITARIKQQPAAQTALKQADVVVMTVGGNDLLQVLEKQVANPNPAAIDRAVQQAGPAYSANLTTLLQTVRKLNPHAPLFVFSIYNPVYVYFPTVSVISQAVNHFNQLTRQGIGQAQPAVFVDVNQLMSNGQYASPAAREKLVATAERETNSSLSPAAVTQIMNEKGSRNRYLSDQDHFHPNHLGYSKMTAALFSAMETHDGFEYQGGDGR